MDRNLIDDNNELESNDDLNEGQNASDNPNFGQDNPNFENEPPQPDTWIRDQFRGCCDRVENHHLPLSFDEKSAIELMYVF
jgi:hypothetical protein